MARAVKSRAPKNKAVTPKAGAKGEATSLARQVIEAEATGVQGESEMETATMEADVTTQSDPTEVPATDTPEVPETQPEPETEPATSPEPEPEAELGSVILANGSQVDPMTVLHCGTCGARFYAKDATDFTCPATDAQGNVCGGTLGPIEA